MQADAQQHDDLRRLNQLTWRGYWITKLIELYTPLSTKTTVPIAQVEDLMMIALNHRCDRLLFTRLRIQNFYPLQHLPQLTIMRTCITDDCATKRSRNPRAKL